MNLSIPLLLWALFALPNASKIESVTAADMPAAVYAPASPAQSVHTRIRAAEFKMQEFCRAECDNFEFNVQFKVVSATVYFSGANFPNVQTAQISSNSLQPLAPLMKRCIPGSIITFDNIRVKGPEKEVRTIQSVIYELY